MEFLSSPLLHSNFSQALFWTFVHSLWQAAFLAIIAGLFLLSTRRTKPVLRYTVLGLLFLSFVLSICITFLHVWRGGQNTAYFVIYQLKDIPFQIKAGTAVFQFLNTNSHLFLLIWSFIFLVKSTQLGIAFRQVHHIKFQAATFPDAYWTKNFHILLEKLKINKPVQLSASKTITTPATIGFLKPVVLVPLGLFSKLPPDQIKVILLHELAHIKRNNYLANNFQKIIETIFFFQPLPIMDFKINQDRTRKLL